MARRQENLCWQKVADPTTERTASHPNKSVGIRTAPLLAEAHPPGSHSLHGLLVCVSVSP